MKRVIQAGVRRCKSRPKTSLLLALLLVFLAINALAFNHAWSMTHFATGGSRTPRPDQLSALGKARVLVAGVRIPRPADYDCPANWGLPYSLHHFSGDDGTTYEAWHIPAAEQARGLALLFHAYGHCKSGLLEEAGAWHELGYDALLVDFRGCGGSSGSETTLGYREADDVAAAYRYACRQFGQAAPVLSGRSLGAVAILRAVAVHGLEPRAVVVQCPFDSLLATSRKRFDSMRVPAFPLAELLVFWGSVQHRYWAFDHDSRDYAAQVSVPTLMLHGRLDSRVTLGQVESIFDKLAGRKQLVVFDSVGHGPCQAAEPDKWRTAVEEFLTDIEAGADGEELQAATQGGPRNAGL